MKGCVMLTVVNCTDVSRVFARKCSRLEEGEKAPERGVDGSGGGVFGGSCSRDGGGGGGFKFDFVNSWDLSL